MPIPIAVAALCVTAFACDGKKRRTRVSSFLSGEGTTFVVDDSLEKQRFEVGAVDMKSFLKNSMEAFPVVRSAQVKTVGAETFVEVTVNRFDWGSLESLYIKELDLLNAFPNESLSFSVIDGSSPYVTDAPYVG